MAIMYPEKPYECEPNSCEDIMFDCLKKLPDTFYVFHSYKIVNVIDETIRESETDFVVVHPEKGILCLEAKAGKVKFDNGWRYSKQAKLSIPNLSKLWMWKWMQRQSLLHRQFSSPSVLGHLLTMYRSETRLPRRLPRSLA